MTYFVYILRTSSNTLYIGQTNNLEKRLKEHKKKSSKSAKYIKENFRDFLQGKQGFSLEIKTVDNDMVLCGTFLVFGSYPWKYRDYFPMRYGSKG